MSPTHRAYLGVSNSPVCGFLGPAKLPSNVLSLRRTRPLGSSSATQSVALNRGAEAPGQRRPRVACCEELARPRSCLSCRSGRIVRLKRTIFVSRAVETLPKHAELHLLRAE